MKILSLILILFIFPQQKNVGGEYYDNFGTTLLLNPDFTFVYKWHFDLSSSWSKGNWKIKNDTIYFTVVPIYDTLRIDGKEDSLILSETEKPLLITDVKNYNAFRDLSTGGQNKREINSKLFFRKDKLYHINKSGKLITKKVRSVLTSEKFNPWFTKKE
jgi:hypothetical protein